MSRAMLANLPAETADVSPECGLAMGTTIAVTVLTRTPVTAVSAKFSVQETYDEYLRPEIP